MESPPLPRTLRDATPADAPALCRAEQAVAARFDGLLVSEPDELHETAFSDRIALAEAGAAKYLVAEVEGRLVAHASLWPMGVRRTAHVLRLDMCVHVGHWRQGHGAALLRALLAWAAGHPPARKVELLVRAGNVGAIALYEQFGFVVEGRLAQRVRLRSGQYMDDLSMALFLDRDAG